MPSSALPVPKILDEIADDYIFRNYPKLQKKAKVPVLFIFIDGLGIGDENSNSNPFKLFSKSIFRVIVEKNFSLPKDGIMIATDPLLHVPGVPQSATGQTALFTGIDAPAIMGRHVPALPIFTLKKIIAKYSIFKRLVKENFRPTLANGYSAHFFERRRRHHSASTLSYLACGLPFRSFLDINAERALFMDITNRFGRKRGYPLRKFSVKQSARILSALIADYDFVMFEYFLTDVVGHTMRKGLAKRVIEVVEDFIVELIEILDLNKIQLIISSDHGNIEDLSQKGHTYNPVPTFLWGPKTGELAGKILNLIDVHRAICSCLGISYPQRIAPV